MRVFRLRVAMFLPVGKHQALTTPAPAARLRAPVVRAWLWLMVASSAVVFVEPAPADILGAGLLCLAIVMGVRVPGHAGLAVLLLGIFLLGNLVASAFAPDPSASLKPFGVRTYLILCWWLLLASLIHQSPLRIYDTIWHAYALAASTAASIGILAFFGLVPDPGRIVDEGGRVTFLFKDPNVFGPFLVPALIYAVYRLESVRPGRSVIYMALLGILGLGLILGFSRGSWLNGMVSLFVFLLLRSRSRGSAAQKKRLRAAVAMTSFAAIAVGAISLTGEPVRKMLDTRAHLTQDYDIKSEIGGTKSRFDIQAETLRLAMAKPQGIGSGQSEMDYYQGEAPHNLFLHTLVESGWIGGFAFHAFIVLTLWRSTRVLFVPSELQGRYQAAFACLIGVLAQSFFIDSTHWRHLYLILALLWGPLHYLAQMPRGPTVIGAGGRRIGQ